MGVGTLESKDQESRSCRERVRAENGKAEAWAVARGSLAVFEVGALNSGQAALALAAEKLEAADSLGASATAADVRMLACDCIAVTVMVDEVRHDAFGSRRVRFAPQRVFDAGLRIHAINHLHREGDQVVGSVDVHEITYRPPGSAESDAPRRVTPESVLEGLRTTAAAKDGRTALSVLWRIAPREVQPFEPVDRVSLPRLHRATDREVKMLPAFQAAPAEVSQVEDGADAWLPGFEPRVTGCPSWLVHVFDRAGGGLLPGRKGAPLELRLFISALCLVHEHDRVGGVARMTPSLREVVDWLYPDGWKSRYRDFGLLPAALDRLGSLRIPVGDYLVSVVNAVVVPRVWDPDALVGLEVRIPRSAAQGARLDWNRLRRYGVKSAAMYRGYLALSAAMDGAARRGMPITKMIPAPVLDEHGKPKRRKGGAIIRSTKEWIPNPAGKYVPRWNDWERRQVPDATPLQALARHGADMFRLGSSGTTPLIGGGGETRVRL